jgi:hypothetical protein
MENFVMEKTKNEIVVYQPDETIHLEVCLEDETVWLTIKPNGNVFWLYNTQCANAFGKYLFMWRIDTRGN